MRGWNGMEQDQGDDCEFAYLAKGTEPPAPMRPHWVLIILRHHYASIVTKINSSQLLTDCPALHCDHHSVGANLRKESGYSFVDYYRPCPVQRWYSAGILHVGKLDGTAVQSNGGGT